VNSRRLALLCLCLAVFVYAAPSRAADWPQWRGAKRDGRWRVAALHKSRPEGGPERLWTASGIGIGLSAAAIADDIVYITGDIGRDLVRTALDMNYQAKRQREKRRGW
jgi:hypothetical protein